jgi:hypothetical protein
VLIAHHRSPLQRLGQIYSQINESFLATYEEFDHFGPRPNVRYWGHWPFGPGDEPQWPSGTGPRIFAYLKPFLALESLLQELRQRGHPTILLGIDRKLQERFASSNLRFISRPLDMKAVSQQCDLAILNAGHGTTVSLLLAGKPCLLLPLFVEQLLFAQKVQKLGAGLTVDSTKPGEIHAGLESLVGQPSLRLAARKFADKYARFMPGQQLPEIVDRLEALIGRATCPETVN